MKKNELNKDEVTLNLLSME